MKTIYHLFLIFEQYIFRHAECVSAFQQLISHNPKRLLSKRHLKNHIGIKNDIHISMLCGNELLLLVLLFLLSIRH